MSVTHKWVVTQCLGTLGTNCSLLTLMTYRRQRTRASCFGSSSLWLHCQSEATQQTVVCISDFVDLKSLKREKFYPSVSGDESEWSQQGTLCRAGRIRSTAAHKVENEWETRDRWWVEQEWMKPGLPATCMCFDRLEDIISLHREKIQFNDRSDSLVRGQKLFTPESISLFTL